MNTREGFTLIELLIVVAIIAILAAIAIPNFLAAQTRAKVARCMADLRTLSVAATAYQLDYNNTFPDRTDLAFMGVPVPGTVFQYLTSPIAYISSFPSDPFKQSHPDDDPYYYDSAWTPSIEAANNYFDGTVGHNREYDGWNTPEFNPNDPDGNPYPYLAEGAFMMIGYGPDGAVWGVYSQGWQNIPDASNGLPYDPSNGTVSWGDIIWRSDYGGFMK